MIATGSAIHRLGEPAVVNDVVLDRRALGTKRPLVDGMIGIAFDVDDRGPDIARFVAERMNNDAATHRAVRAGGARLGGARDFQFAHLGVGLREVEAEYGCGYASNSPNFQEISSGSLH